MNPELKQTLAFCVRKAQEFKIDMKKTIAFLRWTGEQSVLEFRYIEEIAKTLKVDAAVPGDGNLGLWMIPKGEEQVLIMELPVKDFD